MTKPADSAEALRERLAVIAESAEIQVLAARSSPEGDRCSGWVAAMDGFVREVRAALQASALSSAAEPTGKNLKDFQVGAAAEPSLWETCGGTQCSCHDPFMCGKCGCLHNETERAAAEGSQTHAELIASGLHECASDCQSRDDL
jgi:hypothetical protein